MEFEWDSNKSDANKRKHGIDFEEVQTLWNDPNARVLDANEKNEIRFLVVGKIGGKYWTAVVTERGEKIRIISVRAARKEEKDEYDSKRTKNNG